jgi:hypothetical protein
MRPTTHQPALPKIVMTCAVLALAAAFSCKTFDLPNEICSAEDIDATPLHGGSNGACTECLEERCCDKVGVCERTDGCTGTVRAVHDCVLGFDLQGAMMERGCAEERLKTSSEANEMYRCMRDSCGDRCGLPVCRVNQAAVLVATAQCDECFSSSCCPQLNECYGSRACKLMVECIATECRGVLGASLTENSQQLAMGGAPPSDDTFVDVKKICEANAPPGFGAPPCVRDCLCRFAGNDQGLPPEDTSKLPFLLAKKIYDCGVKANCGMRCGVDASSSPATGDAGDASGE